MMRIERGTIAARNVMTTTIRGLETILSLGRLSGYGKGVRAVAFAMIAAGIVAGCNDNPSQVGDDYLPQNVDFKTIDLPLSDFTIVSGIAKASNTSNQLNDAMLVGRAEDGTIAHGLLALTQTNERLTNIDPSEIVSAELRMRSFAYRYGDTASRQVAFDLVSIEGVFGSAAQWHDTLIAKLNSGNKLGEYAGNYPDTNMISVGLDAEATADFLKNYFELDTVVLAENDTIIQTVTLRTLALRATETGSMIGSFVGTSLASLPDSVLPTLRITLADEIIDLPMGVSNWITKYPDSFEFGTDKIVVGGGAPFRTLVKFSLDDIPNGAVIHRAELVMHIDPDQVSRGTTIPTQRVIAYISGDSPLNPEQYLATAPSNGLIFLRGARPAKDSEELEDFFRFAGFGTTLRQWLAAERGIGNQRTAIPNNGFLLALDRSLPSLEAGTVDRLVFFGPDAPEGLRPQLRITYSTQIDA